MKIILSILVILLAGLVWINLICNTFNNYESETLIQGETNRDVAEVNGVTIDAAAVQAILDWRK